MKSSVSYMKLFEPLESRQLRSATSPTPEDGHDYQVLLNENAGNVVVQATNEVAPRVKTSAFEWFDGTPDQGITGAGNTNFAKARIDGYLWWPMNWQAGVPDESGNASESRTRAMARWAVDSGYKTIVIDNEVWGFDIRYHSREVVDNTIQRMKQMLGWIRDEEPDLKIGIYGYMSQSDDSASKSWPMLQQMVSEGNAWAGGSLGEYTTRYAQWQATSEYLQPLASSVDYVFPALYTGVENPDDWAMSAKATIEDSRRYGKPVIPFIWPYFHPGIGGSLSGTALPADYWNSELSLVKQYADGALIWNNRATDTTAPWYESLMAASGSEPQTQSRSSAPAMVAAQPATSSSSLTINRDTDSDTDYRKLKFYGQEIGDLLSQAA